MSSAAENPSDRQHASVTSALIAAATAVIRFACFTVDLIQLRAWWRIELVSPVWPRRAAAAFS
jgi:hypothetical protein